MIRLLKMVSRNPKRIAVTVPFPTCGTSKRPSEETATWSLEHIQWSSRRTLLNQLYLRCLIRSCPLACDDNSKLSRIWALAIGPARLFHLEEPLKPDSSFQEGKVTSCMCITLRRCRPSPWRRHQVMDFSAAVCIMILLGLVATTATSLSSISTRLRRKITRNCNKGSTIFRCMKTIQRARKRNTLYSDSTSAM